MLRLFTSKNHTNFQHKIRDTNLVIDCIFHELINWLNNAAIIMTSRFVSINQAFFDFRNPFSLLILVVRSSEMLILIHLLNLRIGFMSTFRVQRSPGTITIHTGIRINLNFNCKNTIERKWKMNEAFNATSIIQMPWAEKNFLHYERDPCIIYLLALTTLASFSCRSDCHSLLQIPSILRYLSHHPVFITFSVIEF